MKSLLINIIWITDAVIQRDKAEESAKKLTQSISDIGGKIDNKRPSKM